MTVRQSDKAMAYDMTRRMDNASILTSGKAGVVLPFTVAPLFRGDSASGRMVLDLELAEMPRPVENAIIARAQVWCVPRPALPQFSGLDEYVHSYHGASITALNSASRSAPDLFTTFTWANSDRDSDFFKTLGLHAPVGETVNTDYLDAYTLVQNFRLAAHSTKMTRYQYHSEDASAARTLKPAFWPRARMHDVVPDYERALVVGGLELDVSAGAIPVRLENGPYANNAPIGALYIGADGSQITSAGDDNVFADMASQTVVTTLADIDKARTTNAFAKAQALYAGTNFSGFNNDDVIVADLMQGYNVPAELFNRPWLLDSKTVVFGQNERHATDAANLDDSVTTGRAQIALSVNVPKLEYGGIIIATVEIMPERLYERGSDPYLEAATVDDLPNALRDLQRVEPVDTVPNKRADAAHTSPDGVFGYEPMNARHKRSRTSLGGNFQQNVPGTPNTSARTAIWQVDYVDPSLTSDHWLCPSPMPQTVFSVPSADCVIVACQQQLTITGITQFGDALVEDNGEFADVAAEA